MLECHGREAQYGNPEPQAGQFRYYCGDVVYDMAPPFISSKKEAPHVALLK